MFVFMSRTNTHVCVHVCINDMCIAFCVHMYTCMPCALHPCSYIHTWQCTQGFHVHVFICTHTFHMHNHVSMSTATCMLCGVFTCASIPYALVSAWRAAQSTGNQGQKQTAQVRTGPAGWVRRPLVLRGKRTFESPESNRGSCLRSCPRGSSLLWVDGPGQSKVGGRGDGEGSLAKMVTTGPS